jgi:hypothetical protein
MRLEDLGINSKTGYHDRTLTHAENCFLGLLWIDHVGKDNKISADELAIRFRAALVGSGNALAGKTIPPDRMLEMLESYRRYAARELSLMKRDVRRMQNHLLTQHENTPILSKAGNGGGYWIADSEEEAEKFYDSFRQRGLTGLVKASRGKKAVMVEMMTQLSFEFENLIDKSDFRLPTSDFRRSGAPTAMAVVDAFLGKMLSNPERYTEDLRKIGQKFGSVLLPKEQVAAMQVKAQELQEILSGLTG